MENGAKRRGIQQRIIPLRAQRIVEGLQHRCPSIVYKTYVPGNWRFWNLFSCFFPSKIMNMGHFIAQSAAGGGLKVRGGEGGGSAEQHIPFPHPLLTYSSVRRCKRESGERERRTHKKASRRVPPLAVSLSSLSPLVPFPLSLSVVSRDRFTHY